uniref:Conotoxin Czon1107 n=1 Tax=Conus zonatus TaxID=754466 RepID=CX07_CONZO|nr:RecName: Full=Conotoxin Czon1107 [Conus zonatus]
GFRSPCPPFC